MQVPDGPLGPSDIDHFRRHGFVHLRSCFDAGPGSLARRWVDGVWDRIGYDRDDPATWREEKVVVDIDETVSAETLAPRAVAAMQQLCGGPARIAIPTWADAFILNLSLGADRPWVPPGPEATGWHKDGDFFLHFLDSPEQGLLVIVFWDEVLERGGPTYIACDSVGPVARFLAAHPEGVTPLGPPEAHGLPVDQPRFPLKQLIGECRDFRQVTGRAGDVVLMHPFMLHASSQNMLRRPRFITNPPTHFLAPMRFDGALGGPSVVEQAILDGLGVERLEFRISGERRRLVPPRLVQWEERRRQREAGRGAQA